MGLSLPVSAKLHEQVVEWGAACSRLLESWKPCGPMTLPLLVPLIDFLLLLTVQMGLCCTRQPQAPEVTWHVPRTGIARR
jgi:hypothetical protein